MNEEKTEFRVGDRVSWMGLEGNVFEITSGGYVRAEFLNEEGNFHYSFQPDGRFHIGQPPTLKLIKRKESWVKKTVYSAVYSSWIPDDYYDSKEKLLEYNPSCKGYKESEIWVKE